jgi:cytochrome c5
MRQLRSLQGQSCSIHGYDHSCPVTGIPRVIDRSVPVKLSPFLAETGGLCIFVRWYQEMQILPSGRAQELGEDLDGQGLRDAATGRRRAPGPRAKTAAPVTTRLYVNRTKGRTCRACHEVHASSLPFHIRDAVPFGPAGWMLKVNYERTADGASCMPSCHGPRTHRRGGH